MQGILRFNYCVGRNWIKFDYTSDMNLEIFKLYGMILNTKGQRTCKDFSLPNTFLKIHTLNLRFNSVKTNIWRLLSHHPDQSSLEPPLFFTKPYNSPHPAEIETRKKNNFSFYRLKKGKILFFCSLIFDF